MVIDALQDITCHTGIKKSNGKVHELDKKVRNQGDVDTCAQVQQDPTADDLNGCSANEQCQLRKEDEIYKMNVQIFDPNINDTLRQKWNYELQQTASK